jgi:phosphoribosylaminoimidazole-succinocarboxamide synthase
MSSLITELSRTEGYIASQINGSPTVTLTHVNESKLPKFITKNVGKVRDMYICEDVVIMISTDRQSAFDRQLTAIPFKGQVLNLTSLWWFNETKHIVNNHVIASPHPNVVICKKGTVFPIEFVMRGYMTGSTSTSIWKNYEEGMRTYCGHVLPDGMKKNEKLDSIKLTPTTKSDVHDELISAEKIVTDNIMSQQDWDACASYAHQLFEFSQRKAAEKGFILVDTKYEFGKDEEGNIMLIDEIQTPDSSRYWLQESYESRMAAGEEPDNIDKEFLRRWYTSHCDPYNDKDLPEAPLELVNELSRRYIMIYETLLGEIFPFDKLGDTMVIEAAVEKYFSTN